MKMVLIPPGEFLMGSTDEQVEAALKAAEEIKAYQGTKDRIEKAERPQHRVVITKLFLMSATEVSVGEFNKFADASKYVTEAEQYGFGNSSEKVLSDKIGEKDRGLSWKSPGYAVTDESPVSQVTWNDACAFCNWLSQQDQRTPCYRSDGSGSWFAVAKSNGYRLPTEAEWEYACRAGTTTQYSFGDDYQELAEYGWYKKNSNGRARPVGLKPANAFGLHDMHGNMFEWCQDFYDEKWYERTLPNDPNGPDSGSYRVIRGGNWNNDASHCRSAYRNNYTPSHRSSTYGFRPVRAADSTADSRLATGTASTQPNQPWNTPAFQAWVKEVHAMPAEEQVKAVSKKLMELNPGFDGKIDEKKIEKGVVTGIRITTDLVTDISPLWALAGLQVVRMDGLNGGQLADLTPLRDMKLTFLQFRSNKVSDLSPLKGLPLTVLDITSNPVVDVSPLQGMQLTSLTCKGCSKLSDLSPLKGMPLTALNFQGTKVSDLSPLEDSKTLTSLNVKSWKVTPAQVAALQKALPNCKIDWDDPAKAIAGQPNQPSSTPTEGEIAVLAGKTQLAAPATGPIDLLALIGPVRDARKGKWKKEDGGLVNSKSGKSSLELPIKPAASYRLEATVEKLDGSYGWVVGLPVRDREVTLSFDATGNAFSGLSLIDGKGSGGNASRYNGRVFETGKPVAVAILVTPGSVRVECDGKGIIDWHGDAASLSGDNDSWGVPAGVLWIGGTTT